MKYLFLILTFLSIIIGAQAQSISRDVISTAGGILSGGSNQITYTIGQAVSSSRIDNIGKSSKSVNNTVIAYGFQQPGEEIITGMVDNEVICAGSSFSLPFLSRDIGSNNVFTAQLSNADGSFENPVNIGTLEGKSSMGEINVTIPDYIMGGAGYKLRVTSSSPAYKGKNSNARITINVATNAITITIPDFINSLNGTAVDLGSFLPQDAPINGIWYDTDQIGTLVGSVLDPNNVASGNYSFLYTAETGSCPINYVVNLTIDQSFVLGCGSIEVHNAFTPNGDGINENFIIENITDKICYPQNSVQIYDRWGQLVYETEEYDNVNNVFTGESMGTKKVGGSSTLPIGTYFYILNYTSVGLQSELVTNTKQGYLYLTR